MCNAWNHPLECTCGWGGVGHSGRGGGSTRYATTLPKPPETSLWRYENDFCAPSKCRYCGGPVFFIRHNGGSVWIDPPLGWPWPKHPCFYQNTNEIPSWLRYFWKETSSLGNSELPLGIITRARWLREDDGKPLRIILEIDCGMGIRFYLATAPTCTADYLRGHAAIIDLENHVLFTRHDRRPILDVPVNRREFLA